MRLTVRQLKRMIREAVEEAQAGKLANDVINAYESEGSERAARHLARKTMQNPSLRAEVMDIIKIEAPEIVSDLKMDLKLAEKEQERYDMGDY